MSHYFDLDGIREKIFILHSLALSGEPFSREYSIGPHNDISLYSQTEYWTNAKSIASNGVLELAVKIRNAYEATTSAMSRENMITCIENKNVVRHDFIWICNKIIHAKNFTMVPVGSHRNEVPLEWWDGEITMTGVNQNRTPWDISFNVLCWLKSCLFFVRSVELNLNDMKNQSGDLTRCI